MRIQLYIIRDPKGRPMKKTIGDCFQWARQHAKRLGKGFTVQKFIVEVPEVPHD